MSPLRFTLTIESDPADIRVAREFAVRAARSLLPGVDPDVLRLLVSEVVGNAVALDAGPVSLALRVVDGELQVEVRDDGWGQPSPRRDDPARGHGLRLVERGAHEWGVDQFLPGKIVWFRLPGLPGAAQADGEDGRGSNPRASSSRIERRMRRSSLET